MAVSRRCVGMGGDCPKISYGAHRLALSVACLCAPDAGSGTIRSLHCDRMTCAAERSLGGPRTRYVWRDGCRRAQYIRRRPPRRSGNQLVRTVPPVPSRAKVRCPGARIHQSVSYPSRVTWLSLGIGARPDAQVPPAPPWLRRRARLRCGRVQWQGREFARVDTRMRCGAVSGAGARTASAREYRVRTGKLRRTEHSRPPCG